ncbi:hypothetical protein IMG5_097020 [Ichthyophthirius multifiliis]|uniref:Transmembrane protein n=1 Tax=Ichthyophthirius multifiliis TaxID=5932 RepID=G0QRQ4_ICHMU|nr:hypothetical protein IMG5_097020 [Ichthyophthirius multifiliis]EGR32088.1 hypothetical protein IMG5_097020 [Ichthyophthirius multifiliis]|eukprot:XP_004035574.1 hypothetical protein IMG5_097020 [Ichthyophthirius multifiliis]
MKLQNIFKIILIFNLFVCFSIQENSQQKETTQINSEANKEQSITENKETVKVTQENLTKNENSEVQDPQQKVEQSANNVTNSSSNEEKQENKNKESQESKETVKTENKKENLTEKEKTQEQNAQKKQNEEQALDENQNKNQVKTNLDNPLQDNNGNGFIYFLINVCLGLFVLSVAFYRYKLKNQRIPPFSPPSFCPNIIYPRPENEILIEDYYFQQIENEKNYSNNF